MEPIEKRFLKSNLGLHLSRFSHPRFREYSEDYIILIELYIEHIFNRRHFGELTVLTLVIMCNGSYDKYCDWSSFDKSSWKVLLIYRSDLTEFVDTHIDRYLMMREV